MLCRASLIIPAILFYSGLLEIEDVAEVLTYRRNIVERHDNFNHFGLFVLVKIKSVVEFLTYRRNFVGCS